MALQTHSLIRMADRDLLWLVRRNTKNCSVDFFIDTHLTFDPAAIEWPELDEGALNCSTACPCGPKLWRPNEWGRARFRAVRLWKAIL